MFSRQIFDAYHPVRDTTSDGEVCVTITLAFCVSYYMKFVYTLYRPIVFYKTTSRNS